MFVLGFKLKDYECWVWVVGGLLNLVLENFCGDKDFIFLKIYIWEFLFCVVWGFLDRGCNFVLFLRGLILVIVIIE